MDWPKVSVIVSTYNRPKQLVTAVEAILRQEFDSKYEVIVIDDASGTAHEALKPLKPLAVERGVQMLVGELDENSGYQARPKNQGFRASIGSYVAWADDDDIWYPNHLQALVDLIEEGNADGAYGTWVFRNSTHKGPKDGSVWEFIPFNWLTMNLIVSKPQLNFISCHTVLSKAAVLSILGADPWDENRRRFGDWDLYRNLILGGFRFKGTPEPTYEYHWHGENLQLTRKPREGDAFVVSSTMLENG